jgi:outer membrane protein TolC
VPFVISAALLVLAGQTAHAAAAQFHGLSSDSVVTVPGSEAEPTDYVRFALANHPAVAAARYDWQAAHHSIAPAKSLPDPQLTFQADIASTVMSLMPGVMFDLMSSGKRAAMGREAEAALTVARAQYSGTLVRVAAEVRRALVELAALDDAIVLRQAAADTAGQSAQLAAGAYAAGRGMDATLAEQFRAADTAERFRSETAQLLDRRSAARARLKSALGLAPESADPDWPRLPLVPSALPAADELWRRIQTSNPDLVRMRAMVEMAVAGVEVARRGGSPDFSVGLMTDVKAAPWMWRPTATMTLPIWRTKIREAVAAAEARRDAATARVSAEQLEMAADLARMFAMVAEADRMIDYLDRSALPAIAQQRRTAESAYRSGSGAASMILETAAMELAMQAERLAARRERELAVIDLLALSAGVAPAALPSP